ncbi:(R)-mandelonitrile lyase [Cupriavidus pinatubonensis]|uniref:(R)-mandelonitrile lyase n=1 Tax=Cupriavidus pinatubonensis TaxID=248026 RepID=UPI00112D3BE1|nr:cupin domain-containing protein [Cupriavidus pinatubonensis]TPQ39761.1 cupin domain-containing protein [Cupriavidus pinatubonensis]
MITVTRPCMQPSLEGSAANFTGSVRIDGQFQAPAPASVGGATVTFAPGARTAWHSHPLGQTLLVVAGVGFVQQWGQLVRTIRPGDLVWIPPNTKHWHGATTASIMAHIAIAEALEGKAVKWMEQVCPEEYGKAVVQIP